MTDNRSKRKRSSKIWETRLLPTSESPSQAFPSIDQNVSDSTYSRILRDIENVFDDDCSTSEDAINHHPISMELLKPEVNSETDSENISTNHSCNKLNVVDKFHKVQNLLVPDICSNFCENHEVVNVSHFSQEDHQHYTVSEDELVDILLNLQAPDSPCNKSSTQTGSFQILEDVSVDIVPPSEDSAQVGSAQSLEDGRVHIVPPSEDSTQVGSAQSTEDSRVHIVPPSVASAQVESESDRLTGKFVGENVFNLSKKILTEYEISVLSKGLSFCPVPPEISKEQLKQDFTEFARKMRNKWHFRDEITDDFSEIPAFRKKSLWQAPKNS